MKRPSPSPRSIFGFTLLCLACGYIWVLPLFRPRGFYLWGLQLRDVYLGLPLLLALLCATAIALWPWQYRRAFALRAVTVTAALTIALFAADACYSLGYSRSWQASPWFDERAFRRQHHLLDPELGYLKKPRSTWRGKLPDGRPYLWRTDEHGFRNPLNVTQADLVFLGDSFTEAMQVPVEETFAWQVPKVLGRSAVNLGLAGWGPQQQLIALRRYALAYRPKMVVWQVFEGNDLTDAEFYYRWRHGPPWPVRPFWQRYLDNSLVHAWVEPTLNSERRFPTVLASMKTSNGSLRRALLHYPYEPKAPQEHARGWEETRKALREAYRLCQSQRIELRVLFVPVAIRALRDDVVFNLAARREDYLPTRQVTAETDFGTQLQGFCRSLGCPYLDTFPSLQAAAKTRRDLFVPNDEHFDTAGHELVAREIVEWIKSRP